MNNELQVFQYCQTMDVRMVMQGDEPWWVLADVCRVLDLSNPSKVAERLDDDEKMTLTLSEGHSGQRGGAQKAIIINESGLYMVIFRSDKPQAKAFKRWVTHEVLPSIRRTGRYEMETRMCPITLKGPEAAPMPPSAQALWYSLLWMERAQGGHGEVIASNEELFAMMGAKSRRPMWTARSLLVKCGYIEFTRGVKGKPTVYRLLKK